MNQPNQLIIEAEGSEDAQAPARPRVSRVYGLIFYGAFVLVTAALIALAAETILRGSLAEAATFLVDTSRPGWVTVLTLALALCGLDGFMRRSGQSALLLAPLVLALAWIGSEKRFYLGDPPYPTDFLYAQQIVELLPLMVAERPMAALAMAGGLVATLFVVLLGWRMSRGLPRVTWLGRAARLAICVPPLLLVAAATMDYTRHSDIRRSLHIEPKVWDQNANYAHNGLVMAFALNVPMANVSAPAGYGGEAIERIAGEASAAFVPSRKPDIIMVMSESFWDATRLPGVSIEPDPLDFTKSVQSGHVFSPEFGGMTCNIEFEALTGFSNAFLPYGSIPYQQYIRRDTPSLASFLGANGYRTVAMHPFQGWFWNRTNVYEAFGFEKFLSEENLPELPKRGRLASDEAFTEAIIEEAETSDEPVFLFAVTLQNHGPYEKDRYPDDTLDVSTTANAEARTAIHSFAEGMADADDGLQRLIEWADKRKRETVIVFFGDHLPPLGPTYVETGFLEQNVGDRTGSLSKLAVQRETPLVVWSSRSGTAETGTISPSFLPLHTLRAAGIQHPFYTGMLGAVAEEYRVIDRHLLVARDGTSSEGWTRSVTQDPTLREQRLVQYDAMFGKQYGADRLFPTHGPLIASPDRRFVHQMAR